MGGCTEETVFVVADIPASPGCVMLTDCNTVVLSEHLDQAGRERAMAQWNDDWRRMALSVVA